MSTIQSFAYNTGTTISGTIQSGDFAIGTPTTGYTNTPQFWNGPDEDLGYVIAQPVPSGNQPNPVGIPAYLGFFRTDGKTKNKFLELTSTIAEQTFTGSTEAINWLNSNGYWTSYSEVVTESLTLKLDASNALSYPGTGNIWFDLVDPQQNITLVNSPTYTSASPSYFTFNGSNQYGTGSGLVLGSTAYTKSAWFYLNSYTDNNIISSVTGGHFMFMGATPAVDKKIYCGHSDWPSYIVFPSVSTFNLNTWYYVALTFNTTDGMKLYVNGVFDSAYTANKSPRPGNGSTNIGTFGGGNLLNGRVARVYCYTRSLSAAEILQNYNANAPEF